MMGEESARISIIGDGYGENYHSGEYQIFFTCIDGEYDIYRMADDRCEFKRK